MGAAYSKRRTISPETNIMARPVMMRTSETLGSRRFSAISDTGDTPADSEPQSSSQVGGSQMSGVWDGGVGWGVEWRV